MEKISRILHLGNMPKDILSQGNILTGATIELAAGCCPRFVVSRRDVA